MQTPKTRKEALEILSQKFEQVKQLFSKQEPIPAPQKFDEVELADGTKVEVDTLAVGGKVSIEDLPVPDAEHTLKDSTKIKTVNGIITEVIPVTPAEPVAEEMKTPEQIKAAGQKFAQATPEQQQAMFIALMDYCFGWQIKKDTEEANMKAAIDAYKSIVGGQATALTALKETAEQTFSLVKEIADEPIEPPVTEEEKTAYQKFKEQNQI